MEQLRTYFFAKDCGLGGNTTLEKHFIYFGEEEKTKLHIKSFFYKCGGRVIYVVGDLKVWWKINVAGELYIYQGINKCSGVL